MDTLTPPIDWAELEAERDQYLLKHRRCNAALNAAIASIKRQQRKAEFLATRPPADHYLLDEYVADKKRSF